MAPQHVLVFGDQTVEKLPSIQNLIKLSRTSASLRRFLQAATDVVQIETTLVTLKERQPFGSFDNLLSLAEYNAKQDEPDEVVSTVLMCVERLGELILYVENDPSILQSSESSIHVLGFCTGLLPGAVAAFARDSSEIFKYGLEMVSISFRLAIEFTRRSKRIDESSQSWARTVVGATAEELQAIVDDFNQKRGLPILKQVYLGVVSRTWTTIFGPPSVLAQLWSWSSELALAPKLNLAAHTAVHAAHMPLPDLEKIVGNSSMLDVPFSTNVSIISTSTCKPFVASNCRQLLHLIIQDVTQNILYMEGTIRALVSGVIGKGDVQLTAVGPTPHTTLVQRALQSSGVTFHDTSPPKTSQALEKTRGGSDLIAIVGMSGRFPGGNDISEFWETIKNGVDVHEQIPQSRFDTKSYFDPTGVAKNSATTQYGCFLENPGVFDSRLFNVSPREAAQMDPLQRLLLMTSYEALESAGYYHNGSLSTNASRIATYFGQAGDDWRSINESQGIDIYYVPGGVRAFAPGRLNYHFKWGGAYYSVDAACASSSTTVLLACSALIARECDTALAGGGSLLSAPEMYAGLSKGGFLSTTGACKTFSDDADGYCRGEGVGVVVLKRLEDAIVDNDNIQAVIRGAARTYSADAISITQPHIETQQNLFEKVLQQASVMPGDVGYVEMHGTATQAGDTVEMTSVTNVFAKGRAADNPLFVGAVKANVGHGEAAAGITSLIKTVLMLRENVIPPQPGVPFAVNHKFPPLEKMNVRIADRLLDFKARPKGDGKRKVLLNNFDAAGGNTSLLIEDAPKPPRKVQDPRSYFVIAFSARTMYSLNKNKQRLIDHLISHPDINISDLAYTTTARRLHDVCRSAYVAQTTAEIAEQLRADIADCKNAKTKPNSCHSSIIFVFTGQGSQHMGMGRQLFHTSPTFREHILAYQGICEVQGLPKFIDIIAKDNDKIESKTTVQVQLAMIALEIALANLWRSWGIEPSLVLGHSLGEYAALCISGVLSVSDTFHLVGRRASLLQEKCTPGSHAMLAVASSPDLIKNLLDDSRYPSCQISCFNAPQMVVLSGLLGEIMGLRDSLHSENIKSTLLQIPYGFHSPQIEPILEEFETSARGISFSDPLIPVVSTLSGRIIHDSGTFDAAYLVKQARNAVNFAGAMESCKSAGLIDDQSILIEIGPHPVCLGLIRSNLEVQPTQLLPSLKSGEDNWKTISTSIAAAYVSKTSIEWPEYHKDHNNSLRLLELPYYAFELKNYWNSYKPNETSDRPVSTSVAARPVSSFSSTCLQRVEEVSSTADRISVTFTSNTSEPKLYDAIQGHIVDGIALCPASVFYDMAFTAAKFIHMERFTGKAVPQMELSNLEITHALIVPVVDPTQKIVVTASSSEPDSYVDIAYSSSQGTSSQEHGHCRVIFGDKNEWRSEWTRSLHLVKKRVDGLAASSEKGHGHRLMKPVVYKLFANLVHYDQNYQAIEEVYLDNEFSDAAANVKLTADVGRGSFTYSPYWTDAIVHLSGFVLNGNYAKPDEIAYISTGLESLRIIRQLSEDRNYTCYTSILPCNDKGVSLGNVYLFDGSELVALCTGIKFQKMTKAVFGIISGKDAFRASQERAAHSSMTIPKQKLPAAQVLASKKKGHLSRQTKITQTRAESSLDDFSGSSCESATTHSSPPSSVDEGDRLDTANLLLAAVAVETGFDPDDMESSTLFSDMGVDSLMSIAIISAFKKKTNLELPASFFNNFPTVADVREELGCGEDATAKQELPIVTIEQNPTPERSAPKQAIKSGLTKALTRKPEMEKALRLEPEVVKQSLIQQPAQEVFIEASSNVVLMQGRPSSKETPLFLITDGAGSSTAYIHLPPLPNGRRIYALESPYLQTPEDFTCSISEVCMMYRAALRKAQPKGPYMIGGWSAGGVYAYETSRLLLAQGEQILGLIIIDMRVPRSIPDAPEPTMELVEQTGLITGIMRSGNLLDLISQKQKVHLLNTLRALVVFDPTAMDEGHRPENTCIIWAAKGLDETAGKSTSKSTARAAMGQVGCGSGSGNNMEDPETGLRSWFFAKRYTFGPNGWDRLVGEKGIECHKIDADHFSMVSPPMTPAVANNTADECDDQQVKNLGQLLKQAVEKFTT
ncbi:hypothetical protein MMC18_009118 [Xylographa bjoerkii]|nr:hypothetical protein [Xylographa bjoerkii]